MKHALILAALSPFITGAVFAQGTQHIDDTSPSGNVSIEIPATTGFKPSYEIGLETWLSNGKSEWEIEFGDFFFQGKSKLKWEDIDAPVLILNAEAALTPKISVSGSFGVGDIDDGKNTDEDWIGGFQFSESEADTDGDFTMADINIYYQILSTEFSGKPLELDVFVGYLYYEDDLRDQNGVQTIVDEQEINEPFDGLNSTYNFKWQMAKLGVRIKSQLSDAFTIVGNFAVLGLLDYEGEGYWNLRDDFRRDDPNFVQTADSGTGFEGKVSMRYTLVENVFFQGGYRVIYMRAEDGTDKTYFADGSSESTDLSYVESLRHGAFIAAGIIF